MLRHTKLNRVKQAAVTMSCGGVLKKLAAISSDLTFWINPDKEAHRTIRMATPTAKGRIDFKTDISLPVRAGVVISLFVVE
jgi:hypothetical protein